MRIAYVSDIHLNDIYPNVANKRCIELSNIEADYLVMAGDLCSNRDTLPLLSKITPKVKKVIIVKGNHEYYHNDLGFKPIYPDNFYCLEAGKPFIDGDYVFIGDTLWSHVPIGRMTTIENFMNDYALIAGFNGEEITCTDTNELHEKQKVGIINDCYTHIDKSVVVVSHHSPSFNGVSPRFAGHYANTAFHSDAIDEFAHFDNIKLWIHGHTHDNIDYDHDGIRVVCNPWGYMGERYGFEIRYIDI